MGDLPESVIADLRAAVIEPRAGMMIVRPGGAWFRLEEHLHRLMGDWRDAVPDPRDRATFLLLCDELERRDLFAARGLRSVALWDDSIAREHMIAALTEALRKARPVAVPCRRCGGERPDGDDPWCPESERWKRHPWVPHA